MRTISRCCLFVALLGRVAIAEEPNEQAYEPTSHYELRNVEGWPVYVHRGLLSERKELGDKVLELLRAQLYEINRRVADRTLVKLHKIPIWIETHSPKFPCACYHEDLDWLRTHGVNPEKTGAVEIANPETFLAWTHQQPWMVFHELVHGYHDLFLGYDRPDILAAYGKAVNDKSYESVLHWNSEKVRAYALNNHKEYFAELSEAWMGTNDFYPFVRAEVLRHDPQMAEVLERIWGK